MGYSHSKCSKDKNQDALRQVFHQCQKITADSHADRGDLLDFIAFNAEGTYFRMIEAKVGKKKRTDREEDIIKKWPGVCRVVRNIEDAFKVASE